MVSKNKIPPICDTAISMHLVQKQKDMDYYDAKVHESI